MKVINSKLAAIGLAAFVFASCSDSSSDPTDGTNPKVDVAETITANLTSSSAAELAARVSNYKNTTANARKFFFSRATQTRAFASADNKQRICSLRFIRSGCSRQKWQRSLPP